MFASLSTKIIIDLQRGDEDAFNTVYAQYRELLFFIIISIVKDQEAGKDLLQDTFIKVFQEAPSITDPNKFHHWVTTVARNSALNYLKKKKEDEWQEHFDETKGIEDSSTGIFATWHSFLTDEENTIIGYRFVYDLTFVEIARLIGQKLTSTFKIYNTAMDKLRLEYQRKKL
jgi:RNA polymerase sigma-70 factor (ECF subfamily)